MRNSNIKLFEIRDFLDWYKRKQLNIRPRFQRNKVWLPRYQSYFLDTIIRGLPTGLIHINETSSDKNETMRDVVDGQQRLVSILEFYNNEISISSTHNEQFGDKKFKDLPFEISDKFLRFQLAVNVLEDASDPEILDIFARLNTNTVKLNRQELRNAKFHGEFKTTVYELARKSTSFFIHHKIFSTQQIVRMNEEEFISELLLAMELGLQDKKKSLETYYSKYDKMYPNKDKFSNEYFFVIEKIDQIFSDAIKTTKFHNKVLFYSLFLVIYDLYYGLPRQAGPHGSISTIQHDRAKNALYNLHSQLTMKTPSSEFVDFVNASKSQTDNIKPRELRHSTIKGQLIDLIEE
jgi:Protein of unknown function DUF262